MRTSFVPSAFAGAFALVASSALAHAQCDSFVFTPVVHPTGSDPGSAAIGDVNGDMLPDVVVSDASDETLAILLATPGGGFAAAIHYPAGRAPVAVALGDLDLDLDLDAVVCNRGYSDATGWHDFGFSVLRNNAGVFAAPVLVLLPAAEIQPTDVALGDLDGDLDLDVVLPLKGTGYQHSKVASFLNGGTGNFGAASLASTGYDPVALVLGDLDGDLDLDAGTANYLGGSFSILKGNGNGTFGVGYSYSSGAYSQDFAFADIDLDGDLDGALSYRYGVHLMVNGGTGAFTWLATLNGGLLPRGVAFADLDRDLDPDLLNTDPYSDVVYVWLGNGAGGFTLKEMLAIGDFPLAVVPGDLDSDGDPDLAVPLTLAGGVALARNDCALGTYCAGKVNSLGCTPAIGWTGTPSLGGADDFHVVATDELNQKMGMVFFGLVTAAAPFHGGTLCVQPPLTRTPAQSSGGNPIPGDCSGAYDFHVEHAWLGVQGWGVGQELFAQCWSRDPDEQDHIALSNGLLFTLQP